jgi:hypothetical protein
MTHAVDALASMRSRQRVATMNVRGWVMLVSHQQSSKAIMSLILIA